MVRVPEMPHPRLLADGGQRVGGEAGPDAKAEHRAGRRASLPRDACINVISDPPELYISMTIRKSEHLQALLDALAAFAPMLEGDR
jgi:hypothetical protein